MAFTSLKRTLVSTLSYSKLVLYLSLGCSFLALIPLVFLASIVLASLALVYLFIILLASLALGEPTVLKVSLSRVQSLLPSLIFVAFHFDHWISCVRT